MKTDNHEYKKIVAEKQPKSKLLKDCTFAFLIGGGICALGQTIKELLLLGGLDEKTTMSITSVGLIALSVILTSFGLYSKLAKIAGAGTLVPITGFANAVASPAIEFKTEGITTGTSVKMFTIAGPVIVCGVTYTSLIGFVYYLYRLWG